MELAKDGCVCVCVCVRERERERKRELVYITTAKEFLIVPKQNPQPDSVDGHKTFSFTSLRQHGLFLRLLL